MSAVARIFAAELGWHLLLEVDERAVACPGIPQVIDTAAISAWFVREALNSLPSATGWVQDGLLSMKDASDMSWCGTFAMSTLLVRASLLPFVRLQMLENRKLAKALPETELPGAALSGEIE